LQVGAVELSAELAAEFAIEAQVHVGARQAGDVLDMGAEREDDVDFAADPFHETPDFGEIGGHVEP
jgi:hypothetical protein